MKLAGVLSASLELEAAALWQLFVSCFDAQSQQKLGKHGHARKLKNLKLSDEGKDDIYVVLDLMDDFNLKLLLMCQ
jgi:hypothetical protein